MSLPLIILASGNEHKVREIAEILQDIADVRGASPMPEVAETEHTFLGNARLKAASVSVPTGAWVLADDSGLEVDALGGEPGVWSARYAGEDASDAQNRAKLLAELAQLKLKQFEKRRARFRCVLVLRADSGQEFVFEGSCEGAILNSEQGTDGFGYDSLFVPDGYEQSFAQLPAKKKNELSHRGAALNKLKKALATML